MDEFEMKIIKNKNVIHFETKYRDTVSELSISSDNKKEFKRYIKKFFKW